MQKLSQLYVLFLLFYSSLIYSAEENSRNWGTNINLARNHQEFELLDADLTSFTFSPYFSYQQWNFSVDIPWYKIEGDYFVNGSVPRIVDFCNRLQSIPDLRLQFLLKNGLITQEQINRCNTLTSQIAAQEEAQSGVGDVSITAQYLLQPDDAEIWWAALGLSYKFDNGDVETGIGSGSTNTSLFAALGADGERWTGDVTLTYVAVSANDTTESIENYTSITTDLGFKLTDWLTLGVDYTFEQAYLTDGEDIKMLSAYTNFNIGDHWSARASVSDYGDDPEYPSQEWSVSLNYYF
jgi:Putative MetA-pathway of phenol degradation